MDSTVQGMRIDAGPPTARVRTLVLGAGNLLLSDEGFGVHLVHYLEARYILPENVKLVDAGTLGLMISYEVENAERVYLIDALDGGTAPGTFCRYEKADFLWKEVGLKLSPHQIGLREMLLLAEMRGRGPASISLLGVQPISTEPGLELTPVLRQRLALVAQVLVKELVLEAK